jgi:hypothetical protein
MSKRLLQLGNAIDPENDIDDPKEAGQRESDTLAQGGSPSIHQQVTETINPTNEDGTNNPQFNQDVYAEAYKMRNDQPDLDYSGTNSAEYVVKVAERLGIERLIDAIVNYRGDKVLEGDFSHLASNILRYCNYWHTDYCPGQYSFDKGTPRPELNLTEEQGNRLLDYFIERDMSLVYFHVRRLPGAKGSALKERTIEAIIKKCNVEEARYCLEVGPLSNKQQEALLEMIETEESNT